MICTACVCGCVGTKQNQMQEILQGSTMGPERGLELAKSKNWADLPIRRQDGLFPSTTSPRFAELFPEVVKQLKNSK